MKLNIPLEMKKLVTSPAPNPDDLYLYKKRKTNSLTLELDGRESQLS